MDAVIRRGMTHYPCYAEYAVFLEDLRSDPEFQDVLAELKPRWEALVEWERGLG